MINNQRKITHRIAQRLFAEEFYMEEYDKIPLYDRVFAAMLMQELPYSVVKELHENLQPFVSEASRNSYMGNILEADMSKFQALFIRGLTDKHEVDEYKRIFNNLKMNIRLKRYQGKIATLLTKLIDIVSTDDSIYNRVKVKLQRKK